MILGRNVLNRRPRAWALIAMTAALLLSTAQLMGARAAGFVPITKGDIIASLYNGQVNEYTPSGALVQTLASANLPTGSAFDAAGNLFVTEFEGNDILKVDATTGAVSVFSNNTILADGTRFDSPESIAFGPGYTKMYVSDANRFGQGGGIHVIDPATGKGIGYFPLASSYGSEGAGEADWLAFDHDGGLYVTNESAAQGVMKVDTASGDVVQPSYIPNLPAVGYAIAFDASGNLWLSDSNRILVFDPTGTLLRTITGAFGTVFAAVFNPPFNTVYAGDVSTGSIYSYDLNGNLLSTFNVGSLVDGLAVAGTVIAPPSSGPQDVSVAAGNEPSIAVDPTNPDHVIVGYNQNAAGTCAWSESFDGGATWPNHGTVDNSPYGTDPTVRFSATGALLYSCLTDQPVSGGRLERIMAFRSPDGVPAHFTGYDVFHRVVRCTAPFCEGTNTFLDHPSLALIHRAGDLPGTSNRAVVAWAFDAGGSSLSQVYARFVDPDGTLGPIQHLSDARYSASLPFAGGQAHAAAITWGAGGPVSAQLDSSTTTDGVVFGNRHVITAVPDISPTSRVVSHPYAEVTSDTSSGIEAVLGERVSATQSGMVFGSDASSPTSGWTTPAPVANDRSEFFLPGGCNAFVGAYVASVADDPDISYTVRERVGNTWMPLFTSVGWNPSSPATTGNGTHLPRIGDYTSVDCTVGRAWAAWTDARTQTPVIHIVAVMAQLGS